MPDTENSGSRSQLYPPLRTDVPEIRLLELEVGELLLKVFPFSRLHHTQLELYRSIQQLPINVTFISLGGSSRQSSTLSDLLAGKVRCRLRTFNLNDAPEYLALSYVWGDASQTRNISVDGQDVAVTVNLELALRRIHAKWRSILRLRCLQNSDLKAKAELQPEVIGPLWVDALCINQLDEEEKTRQVQLMGNIYGRACLVTAWICEDSEEVQTAVQVIQDVVETVDKAVDQSMGDWEDLVPGLWEADSGQYILNKTWECVADLSVLPYFNRVWILQEIVLGREVVFMIGEMLFGAPNLIRFLQIMKGIYPVRPDFPDLFKPGYLRETAPSARLRRERIGNYINFYSLGFVADLREGLNEKKPLTLLSILCSTPRLQATDPRDKLYGLLSVTSSDVIVDYSKTTTRLCTEFASTSLANRTLPFKNSSILQLSGLDLWATGDKDGPSWVPYWPAFSHEGYQWRVLLALRSDQFFTNRNVPASNLVIRSDDTLCLTVTVCDSIVYVAPHKYEFMSGECEFEQLLANLLCEASEGCSELAERDLHRFVRCLMQDCNPEYATRLEEDELRSFAAALVLRIRTIAKKGLLEVPTWMQDEEAEIRQEANKLTKDAQEQVFALFKYSVGSYMDSQRFARTEKGMFVLAPTTTEIEDLVCVVQDCGTPMLIRQPGDHHCIVGSCFVDGLMDGEAADMLKKEDAFVWDLEIR